jgi:hypothetical protein
VPFTDVSFFKVVRPPDWGLLVPSVLQQQQQQQQQQYKQCSAISHGYAVWLVGTYLTTTIYAALRASNMEQTRHSQTDC